MKKYRLFTQAFLVILLFVTGALMATEAPMTKLYNFEKTESFEVDADGNVIASGGITAADGATLNGDSEVNANLTMDGVVTNEPSAATNAVIASSNTAITITDSVMYLQAIDENITYGATPLLSTTAWENETSVTIVNVGTYTLTIQDEDNLTGSLVETLANADIVLAANGRTTLTLQEGKWRQFATTQTGTSITLTGTLQAEQLTSTDDAAIGDDLTLAGATGSVIIDASAGGSGLIITEALITPSDEELRLDSETQNVTLGDGTNDTVFSDNGAMSQTGTATVTLQDGSDLVITANPAAGPFVSASSNDTMAATLTVTYGIAVATAAISSNATVGGTLDVASYTISGSSNVACQRIAYSLADTGEYTPSNCDAKDGWFTLYLGTHTAQGVFTSAGVSSLAVSASGNASTSDDNDGSLNVFDGGTGITIENQTGATGVLYGEVYWVQ